MFAKLFLHTTHCEHFPKFLDIAGEIKNLATVSLFSM